MQSVPSDDISLAMSKTMVMSVSNVVTTKLLNGTAWLFVSTASYFQLRRTPNQLIAMHIPVRYRRALVVRKTRRSRRSLKRVIPSFLKDSSNSSISRFTMG